MGYGGARGGRARGGRSDAAAELDPVLGEASQAPLAGVLRRILGGERGAALLDGLDPMGSAIVRETLHRVGGDSGKPAE